jgi:hypothetical protein
MIISILREDAGEEIQSRLVDATMGMYVGSVVLHSGMLARRCGF